MLPKHCPWKYLIAVLHIFLFSECLLLLLSLMEVYWKKKSGFIFFYIWSLNGRVAEKDDVQIYTVIVVLSEVAQPRTVICRTEIER